MASKSKTGKSLTIVDDEGYETDGMFRWGGPKEPFSPDRLEEWFKIHNEDFYQSANDRIASLRLWLSSVISARADGPYTAEQAKGIFDRTITYLSLSTGSGCYVLHADVPKHGYVHDAIDAIHALDELEKLIAESQPSIDQIVRVAIRIGALTTRTELRAVFAAEVLVAMKRRKASAKGGKATVQWTAEVQRIAEETFAELKRSKMKDTPAFLRTSQILRSKHRFEFSPSTIRRYLKNSNA